MVNNENRDLMRKLTALKAKIKEKRYGETMAESEKGDNLGVYNVDSNNQNDNKQKYNNLKVVAG